MIQRIGFRYIFGDLIRCFDKKYNWSYNLFKLSNYFSQAIRKNMNLLEIYNSVTTTIILTGVGFALLLNAFIMISRKDKKNKK